MHRFNFYRIDLDAVSEFHNYFPSNNISEIALILNSKAEKKFKALKRDSIIQHLKEELVLKKSKAKKKQKIKTRQFKEFKQSKTLYQNFSNENETKSAKIVKLVENIKLAKLNSKSRRAYKLGSNSLQDIPSIFEIE